MTDEIIINGKAIYSTKGAAREYGRIGCNFYKGCPHNCTYCYLKRGAPSKQLGGTEVRLKKCFKDEEDAIITFCREVEKHIDLLRQTGIFFSFTTDPLLPETINLTYYAADFCLKNGIPVKILSKRADTLFGHEVYRDVGFDYWFYAAEGAVTLRPDNYMRTAKLGLLSFGFTLTGRDDMEPGASSNMERIEAMKFLRHLGFKTFASIEPVIDWVSARKVITLSLDCCDHYMIGLRSGVKKDYYGLVSSGMNIQSIVGEITERGKTVYLKNSVRELLKRFLKPDALIPFLSYTVDMDGNKIVNK